MSIWRRIVSGVSALFRRDAVDRELDDEMRDFVQRATDERRRDGLDAESAARAARVEFGSPASVREEVRAGFWEWSVLTFLRDVQYGARALRRAPGFAAVAIITLALGLGATTAVLSVADVVFFKPLPVRSPEQLAIFSWTAPPHGMPPISIAGMSIDAVTGSSASTAFSLAALQRFQRESRTLSDVVAFTFASGVPSAPGLHDGPSGQLVSGNYFAALGTPPHLGRVLTPDDDRDGAPLVAVLSYRYWQRELGSDPAIIGKPFRLDAPVATAGNGATESTGSGSVLGKPVSSDGAVATIVGVAAAGFNGTGQVGDSPDFFVPLQPGGRASGNKFAMRMSLAWVWPVRIFGRVRPGVSFEDVRRDLDPAFQSAVREAWTTNPRRTTSPAPIGTPRLFVASGSQGLSSTRENLTRAMGMLGAIVGVLLLIVSVNLASLLLARGASRRTELAVRLAIGARRGRLIRQLMTEAVFMTLCGAAGGFVIARWAKDGVLAWINRANPSFVVEPALDLRVLALATGIALVVAVFVGLVPAWRATRVDPNPSMKDGAAAIAAGRDLVGRTLIAAQVALALVLVVTAGLFVGTLRNLQTADVGFNPQSVLLFRVNRTTPPNVKHPSELDRIAVLDQLADRLDAVPGVRAAGYSNNSLLGGDLAMPFVSIPGRPKATDEDRTVYTQAVSPGFFRAMEMPVVLGRAFTAADRQARVAVVNETLVRRFFPDESALGKRLAITKDPGAPDVTDDALVEIVGVVRDARYMTIRETALPAVFLSNVDSAGGVFAVRTLVEPASLVSAVQAAVKEMPVALVSAEFRTQADEVSQTFAGERNMARVSTLFGAVALMLTAIGLYGLLSYRVARRTQEIGIRVALGASRARVVRRVLADVLGIVAIGVVVGLIAAAMVTRLVQSQLYGLTSLDPAVISAAVLLMGTVALFAALLPARRAARVDPLIALRSE